MKLTLNVKQERDGSWTMKLEVSKGDRLLLPVITTVIDGREVTRAPRR